MKVSGQARETLAAALERRHAAAGTPRRLPAPLSQAVLVIAFPRASPTIGELAAGSGISRTACRRNLTGGITALADRGRRITLADIARLAVKMSWEYLIAGGTHVPAVTFGRNDGGQRAFCPGKHKRHGLNVPTVRSPAGDLLRAAAPRPGATADITAARQAGIAATLTAVIGVFADLGYLGLDSQVITGRRRPRGGQLPPAQRAAGRLQAQPRCAGERGNAQLKHWKVAASELQCRPGRRTAVIKAVLAPHYLEHDPFAQLRAA